MRNRVLALFLWFCLPNVVYALNDTTQFARFNIENGLPSNNVYSVVQDRLGYIWILTDNGILKYNGYTFKHFNTSTGLPSSDVWYLKEDSYGRMWLLSFTYDIGFIKDDKFYKIDIGSKRLFRRVGEVYEYNGYVFVQCFGSELDKLELFVVDKDGKVVYTIALVDEMCMAINSTILTVRNYKYNVMYEWTAQGLKIKHACIGTAVRNTTFSAITSNGNAIYQQHGTANLVEYDMFKCKRRITSLTDYGGDKDEKLYVTYTISDSFCIVTDKARYIIDKNFRLISRFDYRKVLSDNLQASFFYTALDKSTWITTAKKGCVQVFPNHKKILKSYLDTTLVDFQYIGATNSSRTTWWYNEFSRELKWVDAVSGDISGQTISEKVRFVKQGLNGQIYLLTRNRILKFDPLTGGSTDWISPTKPIIVNGFSRFFSRNQVKDEPNVKVRDQDRHHVFNGFTDFHEYKPNRFLGIAYSGVRFVEIKNDTAYAQAIDPSKFTDMYFDSVGRKYILYNKSTVLFFDPETKKISKQDISILQQLGIKSIVSVHIDIYRNVFIQTENELIVFNMLNGSYGKIATDFNLANSKVVISGKTILIAGKFGLAYATSNGSFNFSEFEVVPNIRNKHFNRIHDLVFEKEKSVAILTTDKGTFDCKIDRDENAMWRKGDWERLVLTSPFQKVIGKGALIRIPSGTEKITLDYINYYSSGSVSYTYTIVGTGKRESTNSGEIILANLEPGKVHQIQCDIKDDVWEHRNYTFFIEKEPYWYQSFRWTIIFWTGGIIIFLVFIVSTALITKRYVAGVNLKKRAMIDLELRAIYSQINPHFIFNTLSSSQYFISKRNFEEAYLNINKFSRLLRAYLKSSRNKYVTLAEEIGMLKDYIELQKARFGEKLDYVIEVENKIPANDVLLPSLLLQPLVENAINHGLFHKQGGGMLTLRFYQGSSSNEMICEIEDDGVGRARSKQIYAESTVTRESYGTTLTEELIKLYGKYESMNISIKYIDKQLPETGTIVQLRINNLKYVDL